MQLPARIANYLAQAEFDGIEAELEHCLQVIGIELELSLVSLATRRGNTLETTHQWRAIGHMDPALALDLGRAHWFRDQLDEGEDIIIDDVAALPDVAAFESEYFGERMTGALVAFAAGPGGNAFLVAELQRDPRTWSEDDLSTLGEIASHFGASLALHREQRRLVLSADKAGRDSEAKSRFIATLAHELRTPLTAIIGYSQLLSTEAVGPMSEKQSKFISDILSCAKHLGRIVNESLDLAMLDTDRMTLTVDAHDACSLVQAAVASVRAQAATADLELVVETPEARIELFADEVKVRQILINLLTNAIKFTSEGMVSVRVEQAADMVVFAVRDTGQGIAPGNHERIFDSFSRVHRSRSKDEGTGLGLALVKRLVHLHGGDIDVASELGHGSTFTVTLPVRAKNTTTGRPVQLVASGGS